MPSGYSTIEYHSYRETSSGFLGEPLGLVVLGPCVLALLAIGYGAYTHSAQHVTFGRLLLWSGTVLLVLVIALAGIVVNSQFAPEHLVASTSCLRQAWPCWLPARRCETWALVTRESHQWAKVFLMLRLKGEYFSR
jgi:hypothetical protein